MTKIKSISKKLLSGLFLGVYFLLALNGLSFAQTQETSLILSWQPRTITPDGYRGKTLPTLLSTVSASVTGVRSGKAISLSKYNVVWYVNNEKKSEGIGFINFAFQIPETRDPKLELKVSIPELNSFKNIPIPIRQPEGVIEYSDPQNIFKSSPLQLIARPYFFNSPDLSNLSFSWEVNGQKIIGVENPHLLTINLEPNTPGGFNFPVRLFIERANSFFEKSFAEKIFTYLP